MYAACVLLAIANFLQIIPTNAYSLALGISAGVSLLIVIVRFAIRPEQRTETGLLMLGAAIAFIPLLVLGLLFSLFHFASASLDFLLLALPLFPLTYFYAVYRKQLGKHELRANQFFSGHIFFILLVAVFSFLTPLAAQSLRFAGAEFVIPLVAVLLASALTASLFRPLQSLVERYLFGIKLPSDRAIAAYVTRLTTHLEIGHVARLLPDEILPSLLITQSTLIRIEQGTLHPLYLQGVAADVLPTVYDLPALIAEADRYRPDLGDGAHLSWIRVVLPLVVADETMGVWLLGSRAPDDFYSQREIGVLKSIADQTAIVLVNIAQSERLRAMYHANTARHEQQRLDLAHELHDDVLNEIALTFTALLRDASPEALSQASSRISRRIRHVIQGLRPPILDMGLHFALNALPTDIEDQHPGCPEIVAELSTDGSRYDPTMEFNFYRIVQQACENSIYHAQPTMIRIDGELSRDKILITIEDNGVGFPQGERLDLSGLLTSGHYGVANMIERAESHQGSLKINSTAGKGTTITLTWGSPLLP
jgi:signal transduction histidine kinase